MKTLVDTCIWSCALRSSVETQNGIVQILKRLIENNDALLIGPIRQELLSGYSDRDKFAQLKNRLEPFSDLEIINSDYIVAAEFSSECRRNGIQGSHIDFIICAVAYRNRIPIFTVDNDFRYYAPIIPIELYC